MPGKKQCHYENKPMQYTANFQGYNNDNFQMKKCVHFLFFAQNIDHGYMFSNQYPRSMFSSKNKKIMYTSVNQFYYIKVGCKGGEHCTRFHDDSVLLHFSHVARKPIISVSDQVQQQVAQRATMLT